MLPLRNDFKDYTDAMDYMTTLTEQLLGKKFNDVAKLDFQYALANVAAYAQNQIADRVMAVFDKMEKE